MALVEVKAVDGPASGSVLIIDRGKDAPQPRLVPMFDKHGRWYAYELQKVSERVGTAAYANPQAA